MSPEKDAELVAKYPAIFAEAHNGHFGFECDDGWFDLIDALCLDLTLVSELVTADPLPVATQVKEKFGTLRFYVNSATDHQYMIIDKAEKRSGEICETCGKPGKLDTSRSWIKTLCEEHRAK